MDNNMQQYPIGELVIFQRGYDLSKNNMITGKYPVVGSNGIIGYHNKYTTKGPSIVIGRSGNAGSLLFIENDFWAHNTTLFAKDFKGNNPKYIYYLFHLIDLRFIAGGSAVPTLNRNVLHELQIKATKNKQLQLQIVEILNSFDAKISHNTDSLKTYQELILTIYKNTFLTPISKLNCTNNTLKTWQSSNVFKSIIEVKDKNKDENAYPVLSVVKEGEFKLSEEVFTKQIYSKNTRNYKIVRKNEVAYNPARANIGSIAMLKDFEVGLVSPIYTVFKLKDSIRPIFFYYYMKQPIFLEMIKHHAIGTTRQNFPFEAFKMFPIIVPPMDLQLQFEEIAKPIEQKITLLKKENKILAEIRDTFLPKLMNGDISINVKE